SSTFSALFCRQNKLRTVLLILERDKSMRRCRSRNVFILTYPSRSFTNGAGRAGSRTPNGLGWRRSFPGTTRESCPSQGLPYQVMSWRPCQILWPNREGQQLEQSENARRRANHLP